MNFPLDPDDCEHGRWNPDNGQCLDCGDTTPPAPYPSDPDNVPVHYVPDSVSLTACEKRPTWVTVQSADPTLITCLECQAAVDARTTRTDSQA